MGSGEHVGKRVSFNGAVGIGDIEGKAAMGSGERAGKRVSFKSTDKSMSLQELMHVFGQLSANPFRGSDFLHCRSAQAIHRAKLSQQ
jgi:hypothetical protein